MKESARNKDLEKKIDAYVKGDLSEDQTDALWAKLLAQPEYIGYLKTEMALARIYHSEQQGENFELISNGESEKKTTTTTKKRRTWWYSAAAAIILAVVLTSVFVINRQANINQWANQQINLGRNLASAPVTRSATKIPSPDSLLNAGFGAAIGGNIEKAMEIYHHVIKKFDKPQTVAKATYNLGILQYNKAHYKASIQYLNSAVAHLNHLPLLEERAYWYIGNAYINTGQLKKAKSAISNARR